MPGAIGLVRLSSNTYSNQNSFYCAGRLAVRRSSRSSMAREKPMNAFRWYMLIVYGLPAVVVLMDWMAKIAAR